MKEIGSGCGNQLLLMAFLGAEVIGCDIRRDVCDLVKKRKEFYEEISGHKLHISLICEDVFEVNWDEFPKFDALNFLFSFNDVISSHRLIELITRLIKPGGRSVIQDTNQSNYYNRIFRRRDSMFPQQVAEALERYNFKIHSLKGGYAIPPPLWRMVPRSILSPVDQFMCRSLFMSPSYHLMAEKMGSRGQGAKRGVQSICRKGQGAGSRGQGVWGRAQRARILCVDGNRLYGQIGNNLCISDDNGITWEYYPLKLPAGARSYSRMHARLMRRGIHSLKILHDGKILLVAKNVISVGDPDNENVVNSFSIPRGSRPFFVCENKDGYFHRVFSCYF